MEPCSICGNEVAVQLANEDAVCVECIDKFSDGQRYSWIVQEPITDEQVRELIEDAVPLATKYQTVLSAGGHEIELEELVDMIIIGELME